MCGGMKEEETVGPLTKERSPPRGGKETAYPYIIYAKPKGGRGEGGEGRISNCWY
jgi:hypothetical protein